MIRPHQTSSVTDGSSTTNLSRAERPVCTPVVTTRAPSTDSRPSLRRTASATSAGAVRFTCTGREHGRRSLQAPPRQWSSSSCASGAWCRRQASTALLLSSTDAADYGRIMAMIRVNVRNNPAHPHNFELCTAPSIAARSVVGHGRGAQGRADLHLGRDTSHRIGTGQRAVGQAAQSGRSTVSLIGHGLPCAAHALTTNPRPNMIATIGAIPVTCPTRIDGRQSGGWPVQPEIRTVGARAADMMTSSRL